MPVLARLACAFALLLSSATAAPATPDADAARQAVARVMKAVQSGDANALQRTMSPYMLDHATGAELLAVMRKRHMHEFRELHWNEPRCSGPIARVEGVGELESGERRWVEMRLVDRNGWRLAMIGIESAEVIDEPAALDAPSSDIVAKLLHDAMDAFVAGLAERDFTRLYGLMPSHIDEQFSLGDLTEGMLTNVKRTDYALALPLEPVLDVDPRIDDHALLWLEGHYATNPPVRFRHAFQYERGAWRLLRFGIDPKSR